MNQPAPPIVCLDAHAHFYPWFDAELFLQRAMARLHAAGPSGAQACVLLAAVGEQKPLEPLRSRLNSLPRRWRHEACRGATALIVARRGEHRGELLSLLVIAGRQLVSREGIEVLTVGNSEIPSHTLGLDELIAELAARRIPAIIPWGWGKWWFHRAAAVRKVLKNYSSGAISRWQRAECVSLNADQRGTACNDAPLLLGDHAGRSRGLPIPRLFRMAERRQVPILAGSDPLPLEGQEEVVASYGSLLPGRIDLEDPLSSLQQLLRDLREQPDRFGKRCPMRDFVRNQCLLRRWNAERPREAASSAPPAPTPST